MTFKELLETAKAQLVDLTSVAEPDFRLEQAVFDKADRTWEIVVSYLVDDPAKRVSLFPKLEAYHNYSRIYKKLHIDEDNQVIGFYIYSETA